MSSVVPVASVRPMTDSAPQANFAVAGVTVTSAPSRGSRFLPRGRAPRGSPCSRPRPPAGHRRRRGASRRSRRRTARPASWRWRSCRRSSPSFHSGERLNRGTSSVSSSSRVDEGLKTDRQLERTQGVVRDALAHVGRRRALRRRGRQGRRCARHAKSTLGMKIQAPSSAPGTPRSRPPPDRRAALRSWPAGGSSLQLPGSRARAGRIGPRRRSPPCPRRTWCASG